MSIRIDLTVAAIVERHGQFLLVEERAGNRMVFNQPAGHVERGESFLDAVVREALEETAWTFHPQALVGVYHWEHPEKQRSFLRLAYCGEVSDHDPQRQLDDGIERAVWLTREQMLTRTTRLRSPLVMRCVDDYLAGRRFPLEVAQLVCKPAVMTAESRARTLQQPAINRLL